MKFGSYIVFIILFFACNSNEKICLDLCGSKLNESAKSKYNDHSWLAPFERDTIEKKLETKIENEESLVVHCLVPLCDNQFQGIVPTTESLGDGFSTLTNLYWATRNGMKRFYRLNKNWEEIKIDFIANNTILERVAFQRQYENGANVILVCDAYRGDQMEKCLDDYFDFLSGKKNDSIYFENHFLRTGADADMIVFNGHNGLMDVNKEPVFASKKRLKDAVVIACSSHWNYTEHITYSNAYPLVTTTSSLYPGASILDAIICEWALLNDTETIRFAAAKAYHELKDCGMEGANDLFYTGW